MRKIQLRTFKAYLWHILPVFLVACLIVVVLTPVYNLTKKHASDNVKQALEMQLEKELTAIGQEISVLRSKLDVVKHSAEIATLALQSDAQLKENNYLALYHTRKMLSANQLQDTGDLRVIIQFRNNRSLLMNTLELVCDNKENIYPRFLTYEGLDYQQWQGMLFNDMKNTWCAIPVSLPEMAAQECITLNSYYSPQRATTVVFSILVPVNSMLDRILPSTERQTGLCCIRDSRGTVLYQSGSYLGSSIVSAYAEGQMEYNGQNYLIFSQSDPTVGFHMTIGVPERVLYASVEPVMQMIYSIILLALVCAALYCMIYAYFYFRPILSLVQAMGMESFSGRSISQALRRMIDSLNADHAHLQEEYDLVNHQIVTYALQHVLAGAVPSSQEEALLSRLPVFKQPYVVVILEHSSTLQEMRSRFFAAVHAVIEPEWNSSQVIEDGRMLILLPCGLMTADKGLDTLFNLFTRLTDRRVYMAASTECSGIAEAAVAVHQAETAIFRAKLSVRSGVVRYDSSMAATEIFLIPFQKYIDMTSSLVNGDYIAVQDLLSFFKQALFEGETERRQIQRVVENLCESINMAAVKLEAPTIELLESNPFQAMEQLTGHANMLCELVTEQKRTRSDEQAHQILQFIQDHYTDSCFSLTSIADEFRLSEKYISRFIKKQTGLTYSTHIEHMRMEHARNLLLTTHMTVDEIAAASGYEHKNTFYKAFKRHFACVPNDIRSQI